MKEPKFTFSFICDDARREDNGKIIFIGVYGGNILIHAFPAVLNLSIASFVDAEGPYESKSAIRVLLDSNPIAEGGGVFRIGGPGRSLSVFPNLLVPIEKAGLLAFQVKLGGGDWTEMLSIPVLDATKRASSEP